MKKRRVTYGVYNLVEWQAAIRMGKARVKVPFTGGAITTQGVTPATFTTSDPVVQLAIECSVEFKSGRIKIVRTRDLGGDVEIEVNNSGATDGIPLPRHHEKREETAGEVEETAPKAEETAGKTEAGAAEKAADGIAGKTEAAVNESEEIPEKCVQSMTQVEFSCNDDARDYLEQNFGFIRSKLRNREDILNAGKSKNVEILFV